MTHDALVVGGVIALVILSITTHEASHGYVANRLGDPTAREAGRLTLNPIRHIDLFFTILLPVLLLTMGSPFIFGGAKPVPVDVSRLRNPRRDWALVGAAGPLANLAIAFGLSGLLAALADAGLVGASSATTAIITLGMFANALLALFNLIPIPPLDGSRVAQYFLRGPIRRAYARLERVGLLLIAFLVLFVPPVHALLVVAVLAVVLGVASVFGVEAEVELALERLLSG